LFQRLSRFKNGIEIDFSAFDGTVDQRSFVEVANLRYSMLIPEYQNAQLQRAIQAYYSLIVWSYVIMGTGDVYQKNTGNPSGQTNTIVDNTMINELRWYLAWVSLCPHLTNLAHFRDHVELILCGDDSAASVSDDVKEWFNPMAIVSFFKSLGWNMKVASETFVPISHLEYCSTKFSLFNGYVVPVPASKDKLLAAMLLNGSLAGKRGSLLRSLAIRSEVFFHMELFPLFDGYVRMLLEKHYNELVADHTVTSSDPYNLNEIMSVHKDYEQLLDLYLGSREIFARHGGEFTPYDFIEK